MTTVHDNGKAANGRMPAFFIPHGAGPCFFMDWKPADTWNNMAAFLKGIVGSLPSKPRAIVLVSGHWLESQFSATGHASPELIYDYYGFPAHTYELKYPAPGAPELAEEVTQLLADSGLGAVHSPGSLGKGLFLDDGHKRAQRFQINIIHKK